MTRVFCIDPGMRVTGYAVFDDGLVIAAGSIRPQDRKGQLERERDFGRLQFIEGRLAELIAEHEPRVGVVETYGQGRSAKAVRAMAAAWAMATTITLVWALEPVQVTSFEAKKAIGLPTRSKTLDLKAMTQARVRELHPELAEIRLPAGAAFEHCADAIALYHGARMQQGGLLFDSLPQERSA